MHAMQIQKIESGCGGEIKRKLSKLQCQINPAVILRMQKKKDIEKSEKFE